MDLYLYFILFQCTRVALFVIELRLPFVGLDCVNKLPLTIKRITSSSSPSWSWLWLVRVVGGWCRRGSSSSSSPLVAPPPPSSSLVLVFLFVAVVVVLSSVVFLFSSIVLYGLFLHCFLFVDCCFVVVRDLLCLAFVVVVALLNSCCLLLLCSTLVGVVALLNSCCRCCSAQLLLITFSSSANVSRNIFINFQITSSPSWSWS